LGLKLQVDIWKVPKTINNTMDLHVNAKNVKEFVTELESLGTEYKPWIEDL
jgi:hypothetical protein